ncbi:MAG: KpsF/GutQ family sugar-phosphate isomerase [Thermogutta sp.]
MEAVAHHLSEFEQLVCGRGVLRSAGEAILGVASGLGRPFCLAVEMLFACRGHVVVSGLGKAGLVGQKISATLASTGTPSHFLHPTEALHGDLGRVRPEDVALILSASGETEEIIHLVTAFGEMRIPIIALTCSRQSRLAKLADVVLELGTIEEAGHLRLAPSTSTTVMLALGDALALTVSQLRGFRAEDFARFHPGGSLGKKLSNVEEHMRPLAECRIASDRLSLRQVIVTTRRPGRRTGAIMLVDAEGKLSGIFTDSDLAKILERREDPVLDAPIAELMTRHPITVSTGTSLRDAVAILAEKKISELPVVDGDRHPVGLLDITDVVALFPDQLTASCTFGLDEATPAARPAKPHFAGRHSNPSGEGEMGSPGLRLLVPEENDLPA